VKEKEKKEKKKRKNFIGVSLIKLYLFLKVILKV
jgi:hypothetical protein